MGAYAVQAQWLVPTLRERRAGTESRWVRASVCRLSMQVAVPGRLSQGKTAAAPAAPVEAEHTAWTAVRRMQRRDPLPGQALHAAKLVYTCASDPDAKEAFDCHSALAVVPQAKLKRPGR